MAVKHACLVFVPGPVSLGGAPSIGKTQPARSQGQLVALFMLWEAWSLSVDLEMELANQQQCSH